MKFLHLADLHLIKYQPYTESSSERIEKLVRGLSARLTYLESEIRKSVNRKDYL